MTRHRVRLRYTKQGDLRWISHRDLVRTFERWFRRAGLRLGMTEGFHPRPRMSFPLAIPLGIEGCEEVMEFELAATCEEQELRSRLDRESPNGLAIGRIEIVEQGTRKPRANCTGYMVRVPGEEVPRLRGRIAEFQVAESYPIDRGPERPALDMRLEVGRLELLDDELHMEIKIHQSGGLRARDVLEALGLAHLEQEGMHLTRTRVVLDT